MAKIIAVAENFAFGPISKLVTVTDELAGHGHEIIFIGEGTAYQLGSKHDFSEIYRYDTDSDSFMQWGKKLFNHADALLSSCDRSSILLAQDVGLPTIWLDILFWWWDEIPEYVQNVDLYIQQNSLKNDRNMQKYGDKIKNMKIVGPIIDLKYQATPIKKQLLIGYGGMEAEGWYKIGKDSNYPFTLSELIVEQVETEAYNKVLFVGNQRITDELNNRLGNDKFRFTMLPHDQMLEEMAASQDLLIIPGLETPLEAFAYQKPVFFLPPSNSSQYVQLDEFRELGLATKENSIHFADYFPYKNLAGRNLRKIMEEFLAELHRFENSEEILSDTATRINNYLALSEKDKNTQKSLQKQFIDSLGGDGLQQTVTLINSFVQEFE